MNDLKLTNEQEQMIQIFTKALPLLRKELGVSQTELGLKIGKSRQMISLMERGLSNMSWNTFLSIVLFFKVNYEQDKKNMTDVERFLLITK